MQRRWVMGVKFNCFSKMHLNCSFVGIIQRFPETQHFAHSQSISPSSWPCYALKMCVPPYLSTIRVSTKCVFAGAQKKELLCSYIVLFVLAINLLICTVRMIQKPLEAYKKKQIQSPTVLRNKETCFCMAFQDVITCHCRPYSLICFRSLHERCCLIWYICPSETQGRRLLRSDKMNEAKLSALT